LSLAFLIRRDDVVRFLEMAEKDKAPEGIQWLVYLTVTQKTASFHAGSSTFECPIHNATLGKVMLPISSLAEVVACGWHRPRSKSEEMGKTEWAEMTFVDGKVFYGKRVSSDEGISLACTGTIADYYPTQAEIILLDRVLAPETLALSGLPARLPAVLSNLERATSNAASSLERYGVTEEDIKEVVEKALKRAEPHVGRTRIHLWNHS
jgi:hypothetical protein